MSCSKWDRDTLSVGAMSNLCNLNGEIVPEEDARISIMDRGFLFGDSIYEVLRTRHNAGGGTVH